MKLTTGSKKQPDVPNIHAMMGPGERVLRTALLQAIIEFKRPVLPAEIPLTGMSSSRTLSSTMQGLLDKGLLVLNNEGAVSGVYPVSALVTRHTVRLQDGRFCHAMCAIDSLGIAFECNQDIKITSSCRQCNTHIAIQIENGKLTAVHPSTAHALHVDIQKYKDWASSC